MTFDREFWRDGMWDTDDGYRRMNRAKRDIAAGKKRRDIIIDFDIKGDGKTFKFR